MECPLSSAHYTLAFISGTWQFLHLSVVLRGTQKTIFSTYLSNKTTQICLPKQSSFLRFYKTYSGNWFDVALYINLHYHTGYQIFWIALQLIYKTLQSPCFNFIILSPLDIFSSSLKVRGHLGGSVG